MQDCYNASPNWPFEIEPDLCYEVDAHKRAVRRAHRERLMKARRNYWGNYRNTFFMKLEKKHCSWLEGIALCKVVDTPHPCSCPICGNPRRHFETPTDQEIRNYLAYCDQLEELGYHRPHFRGRSWWDYD